MKNIFWNFKNSFVGIPFIRTGLEAITVSSLAFGLGYYAINKTLFKTKGIYYDLNDQDICEA
jgi:hypothetical protein